MDESAYETFEDELGTSLREEPPGKSVRQIRRADMQASRNIKEEPPSPQNIPKPTQREISRTMSIRRALSIQNLAQMDSPWEGVTLNRCLFVAITILLISSGLQRLHVALKALRAEEDEGERVEEDGGRGMKDSLALRHAGLKQDRTPPQPESSLWDTLFWWVLEDDDDEDEEEESADTRKTETGMKGVRGGAGRAKHRETPGSAGRKREKRKEKRGRGREPEEEEGVMGKRRKEKRETVKQWEKEEEEEDEEEEERPRKKPKKSGKQEKQKGSEVTKLTE
ncbi:uncharacterized protein DDB_G0283697 isoform X2 [Anguilla rostrata]